MSNDASELRTRPSLLVRLRDARDQESWETFVEVYAPLIYGYARKQGLQDADAADVTQDVLSQAAISLRSFTYQPEKGRFRDWLGMVTKSKIIRMRTKSSRAATVQGGSTVMEMMHNQPDPAVDGGWTELFQQHLLQTAITRLQPHFAGPTWLAFERVWLKQQSAEEAARALNLPISAIYVAKSRVLKRLREEILILADDLPQLAMGA